MIIFFFTESMGSCSSSSEHSRGASLFEKRVRLYGSYRNSVEMGQWKTVEKLIIKTPELVDCYLYSDLKIGSIQRTRRTSVLMFCAKYDQAALIKVIHATLSEKFPESEVREFFNDPHAVETLIEIACIEGHLDTLKVLVEDCGCTLFSPGFLFHFVSNYDDERTIDCIGYLLKKFPEAIEALKYTGGRNRSTFSIMVKDCGEYGFEYAREWISLYPSLRDLLTEKQKTRLNQ